MKKRKLRLLVTAALMASVLAGCGSSAGISNQYAADTAAATTAPAGAQEEYLYDAGYGEYEAAEAAAEDNAAAETGSITQAEEVKEDPRAGRKLITTMNLSAETEYFDDLMGNLEKQITELGGYVESSNQWNGKTDVYGNRLENRNVYLVIRIPAEKRGGCAEPLDKGK